MGDGAQIQRPGTTPGRAGLGRPYPLRSTGPRTAPRPPAPADGNIRVATVNAVPLYLEGLKQTFAGTEITLDHPPDLPGWAIVNPRCVVLVVVQGGSGVGHVVEIRRLVPRTPIVTVMQDDPIAPQTYWDLFEARSTNVLALSARPDLLVEVIRAAVRGMVIMSAEAVRSILARASVRPIPEWLGDSDVALLARMACGATIETLAREFGYSERAMYRRLKHLYQQLGVSGRVDAIGLAAQWGLTGPHPAPAPPVEQGSTSRAVRPDRPAATSTGRRP